MIDNKDKTVELHRLSCTGTDFNIIVQWKNSATGVIKEHQAGVKSKDVNWNNINYNNNNNNTKKQHPHP